VRIHLRLLGGALEGLLAKEVCSSSSAWLADWVMVHFTVRSMSRDTAAGLAHGGSEPLSRYFSTPQPSVKGEVRRQGARAGGRWKAAAWFGPACLLDTFASPKLSLVAWSAVLGQLEHTAMHCAPDQLSICHCPPHVQVEFASSAVAGGPLGTGPQSVRKTVSAALAGCTCH